MGRLKSSWELKAELEALEVSDRLRAAINRYLELEDANCTGKARSVSNLTYRGNLHYIIDNIKSPDITKKLEEHNRRIEFRRKNPKQPKA